MHVDRSRFLFLTASLAAAACNQPQPATTPDTGGVDPAGSSSSGSAEPARTSSDPSVWLEIEPGSEDKPARATDPNCNNQVGSAKTCSLSPPPGHCESFDSTVMLCSSFTNFMQPRAAEAAVDCMLAASGTQRICEWELWNQCTGAGLQASCIEPSTRPECESISSQCGGSIDVFTCQQALSSVRPQLIEQVASCVREFCEVTFCVTNLGGF
ncbi:MAG TPA: hypothetical protein VM869_19965 [Enhygromyxa sp.]|nr:hypothetical protein [Enhygromyxa sp.]